MPHRILRPYFPSTPRLRLGLPPSPRRAFRAPGLFGCGVKHRHRGDGRGGQCERRLLPSSGSPAASMAALGRGPLARDRISSETTLAPLRARGAAGAHTACAVKHGFQCREPALSPHRRGSGFAQRPHSCTHLALLTPPSSVGQRASDWSWPFSEMACRSVWEHQAAVFTARAMGQRVPGGRRASLSLPQPRRPCCPVCRSAGCEDGQLPRSVSHVWTEEKDELVGAVL